MMWALAKIVVPGWYYLAYVIEDKRTGSSVGTVGCSFYEDMGKVGVTYFIGADFLLGKQLGPKNMSSG